MKKVKKVGHTMKLSRLYYRAAKEVAKNPDGISVYTAIENVAKLDPNYVLHFAKFRRVFCDDDNKLDFYSDSGNSAYIANHRRMIALLFMSEMERSRGN